MKKFVLKLNWPASCLITKLHFYLLNWHLEIKPIANYSCRKHAMHCVNIYPRQKFSDSSFVTIISSIAKIQLALANTRGDFKCWFKWPASDLNSLLFLNLDLVTLKAQQTNHFVCAFIECVECRIFSNVCTFAFGHILWFDMLKSENEILFVFAIRAIQMCNIVCTVHSCITEKSVDTSGVNGLSIKTFRSCDVQFLSISAAYVCCVCCKLCDNFYANLSFTALRTILRFAPFVVTRLFQPFTEFNWFTCEI